MDRSRELVELAQAVAADPGLTPDGWRHLVLVDEVESGSDSMFGFDYPDEGKAVPVSPSGFVVFDVLERLREAMAEADGGRPWVAALFRIERATGEVSADFEYDRPDRWSVTPVTLAQRVDELDPRRR